MYKNKNRSIRLSDSLREIADNKCKELGIPFNKLVVNLLEIYLKVDNTKDILVKETTAPTSRAPINITFKK
jgi:hypothetical protein